MQEEQRRSYIRFDPESLDIALIDLKEADFQKYAEEDFRFHPEIPALIIDQSYKGCSLVLINYNKSDAFLAAGTLCLLKVGDMAPLRAEIRWRESLSPETLKIGFEFLD